MTTIKELKQQVREALGFTEIPNEQFTKGRCNGILLNRLNYDSTSFVKATSLQGYNGKEYWEYALVIAKSLFSKKDEVTKTVEEPEIDINLTGVGMSGISDNWRQEMIDECETLYANGFAQYKEDYTDQEWAEKLFKRYGAYPSRFSGIHQPYNASIHQFMLAVYLRTTFRIIEECAKEARKEGDVKFNTSYIDVTDFICDVGMTIIHCYDCIPAHWELSGTFKKTFLSMFAEIPVGFLSFNANGEVAGAIDWDYELNIAYWEPLPSPQWYWNNETNTILDGEDIDQKVLALAGR